MKDLEMTDMERLAREFYREEYSMYKYFFLLSSSVYFFASVIFSNMYSYNFIAVYVDILSLPNTR